MSTSADKVFSELQKRARESSRGNTQLLLTIYVHERFLARLAGSDYVEQFVLKGGMLLASKRIRSATKDADVLVSGLTLEAENLKAIAREILDAGLDDGVEFDTSAISAVEMREGAAYSGIRLGVDARVGSAKVKLKLDVSTGDPFEPEWVSIEPLLGGTSFSLRAYRMESVLAEKIETIVSRGDANSRMRDFADVLLISAGQDFAAAPLLEALEATADYRETELVPIGEALTQFESAHQVDWERYLVEAQLGEVLPRELKVVMLQLIAFVDPLVIRANEISKWNSQAGEWI